MNTSPKHTPGPWHVHIEKHAWGQTPHITSSAKVGLEDASICTFNGLLYRSESETECNAKLIAAAPDLLRAVELLLAYNEMGKDHAANVFARAVLAKATKGEGA